MEERRNGMQDIKDMIEAIARDVSKIREDGHATSLNVAVLSTQMKTLIDADLPDRMTKAESVTGAAIWLAGTVVTAVFGGLGWVAHKIGLV